ELAAQPGVHPLGLADVAGGPAELVELRVHVGEPGRGGQLQDRDLESGQPLDQPAGTAVHQHQVRLVADDRLDVGLESGQLGHGRLRRVVRVTVDRLDLAACADRV